MNEETVARLWQSGWRGTLVSAAGQPVAVAYPGRRCHGAGPDFRDAVVHIGGHTLTGDVEVHVRSSDWTRHGHHRDAAYSGTILHVVAVLDQREPAADCTGRAIAEVELAIQDTAGSQPVGPRLRCPGNDGSAHAVWPETIAAAGLARFAAKTGPFLTAMGREPPVEVLYRAIARALGYALNTGPFERLARAASITRLEALGLDRDPQRLHHYLLQAAGLERLAGGSAGGEAVTAVLRPADWRLAGVRPANSPLRRVAALSLLLHRYDGVGLLPAMLEVVARAGATGCRALEAGLTIPGPDGSAAVLGRECAARIAVNVLLPFASAWGSKHGDTALAGAAADLYQRHPRLMPNELTGYMETRLGLRATTACQQQGLLHIYRNWCREKRCEQCPVRR